MLFACEKPVDLGPEKISIESSTVPAEIPVEGGEEYTLELTATVDWELRGYDEDVQKWLSINPSSGKASASSQTIKIKAMSNTGGATRKADLEIYGNPMARASLTITQLGDLVEDGTAEHPYSVATALRLIDENGWTGNDNVSETVYVKGIVSTGIDESDFNPEKFGNATYKISDDGTTASELEVYRGYYLGGVRFTSLDQLKVGDEVIVKGELTKFSDTYELTQGNEIYSLNGVTAGGSDNPGTPEGSGTVEDPFNVAGAFKYIDENQYYGTNENPNLSPEVYVEGTITSIEEVETDQFGNATYCISDGEGYAELEVFRGYYLNGDKFTSADQIKVGDEVVVAGQLTRFFETYEFTTGSRIYSLNGQGGTGGEDPGDPVTEPASATPVTIAEFLEKPVNNDDWYELTGEIISIVSNNAYGNFTIRDDTGSVYIYGMVQAWAGGKNDQSFNKIGLKVGDTVTLWSLRDEYNGQPQGGGNDIPAIYKSHVEGEPVEPEPLPDGSVVLTFPDDNSENNKVNGYDEPWTAISGDYSFTMTAFNNFEWKNWTYVRCGRKSASVAYIETDDAMPRLSSVEVEIGSRFDSADVNDLYLAVYSDAGMTRQVGENIEPEGEWTTNTVLVYDIPESVQAENLYYQLTFDCAASSKDRNGLIEVSKVTYIAAE
ncbi:MAG TPA: hypothetical protein IAC35_06735 [Candidatus Cryptobacteroides merdipullorum]|uniref:BACON domain-containing protein n=1 Tax=Candidatus Cryptobacteroides merdipullorum TaxID=2840771 RepID=A0A9D1GNS1_9BACT|nr:hypothetical protein [Candidatus Cryptobacteroides merdipullorum]